MDRLRALLALCACSLSGCAWIAGSCELDYGDKRAACDQGGWIIIIRPAPTIEATVDVLEHECRRRLAPSLANE